MPYRASTLRPPVGPRRPRWYAIPIAFSTAALVGALLHRRAHSPAPSMLAPIAASPSTACADARIVGSEQGRAAVTCRSVRVLVGDAGPVAVPREHFASLISAAVHVDDGWVFLTVDGSVARSDTFLGPIAPLGRVACTVLGEVVPSAGRLAVLDLGGSLWTTDGRRPVARAALPSPALSASFADARRGAVVLDDGALLTTTDGGARWARVDLGTEVATSVLLDEAGLVVNTSAGALLLTARGPKPWDGSATVAPSPPERYADLEGRVGAAALGVVETFPAAVGGERCATAEVNRATPFGYDPPFGIGEDDQARYRCHIARRRVAPDRALRAERPSNDTEAVEVAMPAAAGWVDARLWLDPDGSPRLSAAFGGIDASGPFAGLAGPLTRDVPVVPVFWNSEGPMMPVRVEAVLRSGVLVSSEALGDGLLWGARDGSFVPLGRPSANGLGDTVSGRIVSPLTDGGVALVYWSSATGAEVVVALDLDANGAVRQHRAMLVDGPREPALARWGEELGVALWHRTDASAGSFYPLAGGAPRALPAAPTQAVGPCAGATTAGALDAITLSFRERFFSLEGTSRSDVQVSEIGGFGFPVSTELEWTPAGVCVRSFVLMRNELGDGVNGSTTTMRARPGGRFEGSLDDRGEAQVVCRPDHRPRAAWESPDDLAM